MKKGLARKLLLMAGIAICILSAQVMSTFAVSTPNENSYRVVDVAHRGGAAYAPENTMAAFMNGFELKADFIELDVAMTKDGVLIVIHDDTVDRTTNGTGKVVDLTYDYIRTLDAGSWFSPEFAGEHVPTLGEVLDAFRGKIGILIEIKDQRFTRGLNRRWPTN